MAVTLEQFVKNLSDSGILAPGKLEKFVPPDARPKDAQELARQLVQHNQLTKYQAQEIYLGRVKSQILGNSDTSVEHLSALIGLKSLNLFGTGFTEAGVATLQTAMPKCKISWPVYGQFYTPAKPAVSRPAASSSK